MELFDENIKYEIMKEFRKIYGDKLDYIFLKYNSQFSQNIIELALRNIKLAKEKMLKLGTNIPSKEDPEIIEFLQKYEKEFEYMLLNYSKEQKYQDIIKQKRINNCGGEIKKNQKIEEINNIKIEKEIQRRQKAKEKEKLKIELQKLKNSLNGKGTVENKQKNNISSTNEDNKRQNSILFPTKLDLYKSKQENKIIQKDIPTKFEKENTNKNIINSNRNKDKEKEKIDNPNKINIESKPPINLKFTDEMSQLTLIPGMKNKTKEEIEIIKKSKN